MPHRALLFDLDGTLLNTLEGITLAGNAVLAESGFATYSVNAYRLLVGAGVRKLFERALPPHAATPALIESCAGRFRDAYRTTWTTGTRAYDGIPELLGELARRQLPMAVLSNKPDEFTQQCVREYFANAPFAAVLGERQGVPPKPDPTGARQIVKALGIPPGQFLYLGDTSIDMETARSAGMTPLGALWGFRDREELVAAGAKGVIAHPRELLEWL
jgi:phosphoglycolate phosphatase